MSESYKKHKARVLLMIRCHPGNTPKGLKLVLPSVTSIGLALKDLLKEGKIRREKKLLELHYRYYPA